MKIDQRIQLKTSDRFYSQFQSYSCHGLDKSEITSYICKWKTPLNGQHQQILGFGKSIDINISLRSCDTRRASS